MALRVVLLTHRVAVDGMGMPRQTQAAVDVAIVFSQPEVQRAGEGRDERDVGQRAAHEVVAPLCRPMDQVVQVGQDGHAGSGYLRPGANKVIVMRDPRPTSQARLPTQEATGLSQSSCRCPQKNKQTAARTANGTTIEPRMTNAVA